MEKVYVYGSAMHIPEIAGWCKSIMVAWQDTFFLIVDAVFPCLPRLVFVRVPLSALALDV
jgi:hypothetical protein